VGHGSVWSRNRQEHPVSASFANWLEVFLYVTRFRNLFACQTFVVQFKDSRIGRCVVRHVSNCIDWTYIIAQREAHRESQFNDLWRTVPESPVDRTAAATSKVFPAEPQENILYFIEKYSPKLELW